MIHAIQQGQTGSDASATRRKPARSLSERFGPESRCPVIRGCRAVAAFTLIELLVVVAIVTLLVGILVPALSSARKAAKQTREMTGGGQLMLAYQAYANDFKGELLPGYPTNTMVSGGPNALRVIDDKGAPITGVIARRYPWRIAPYLDYNFSGLYDDPSVLEKYRQRTDFQYVVSLSPSLGINADFVGGKGDPGLGFNSAAISAFGKWYVTRNYEVKRTSQLLVFCSARGVDPFNQANGVQPGFYLVDSPRFDVARWTEGAFDREQPPERYGYVDARWGGKGGSGASVVSFFDGHTSVLSFEELRDMRYWSDKADRPDWGITTR